LLTVERRSGHVPAVRYVELSELEVVIAETLGLF
jgi:hypothetical protein